MNKIKSAVCLATFYVCGDEYCTRKIQVLVALAGLVALGHVLCSLGVSTSTGPYTAYGVLGGCLVTDLVIA